MELRSENTESAGADLDTLTLEQLEQLAADQEREFAEFKAQIEAPGKRLEETQRAIRRKKIFASLASGNPADIRRALQLSAELRDEDKEVIEKYKAHTKREAESLKKEMLREGARLVGTILRAIDKLEPEARELGATKEKFLNACATIAALTGHMTGSYEDQWRPAPPPEVFLFRDDNISVRTVVENLISTSRMFRWHEGALPVPRQREPAPHPREKGSPLIMGVR